VVHGGPETTVVSGPDYTTPNWAASALVVVDLQRDFLDGGAAAVPGTSAVRR